MRAIFKMAMTLDNMGVAAGRVKRRDFANSSRECYLTAVFGSFPRGGRSLVQVLVRDNNVDQALRALKKKMQREGLFREIKLRRNYEKPSERRAREKAEAVRRYRKLLRKRMEREGY